MAISNNQATRVGFHRAESSSLDANAHTDDECSRSKLGSEGSNSNGDPWVGTTVGKYLIEAVIASGGMGTVYKAKQTLPVQRSVALKMIRIGMADLSMIERFTGKGKRSP